MNGAQGDLHADAPRRCSLAAAENSLDKLEATGTVKATVDKRLVTGTRLVYFARRTRST